MVDYTGIGKGGVINHPFYKMRSSRSFSHWRQRIKPQHLVGGAVLLLVLFYYMTPSKTYFIPLPAKLLGMHSAGGAPGADVVLVTAFDEDKDGAIVDVVRKNREVYARRHGYATFFPPAQNYSIQHGPSSWAKVPAVRHAMTLFPQATYFFYLEPHSLIMNTALSLTSHIMDNKRLESLMVPNVPIVPPDSVIKTYQQLKGSYVDFVITQDKEGLSEKSFVLRRGEWAKYMLDAWFDPLYRTYNFQRAERHALEHIIQWHGTMLAKLGLVPQNIMNSYHQSLSKQASAIYKPGDFVISFGNCDSKCGEMMDPFVNELPMKR